MRGGARKGTGGAMPGAGRKPDPEPMKPRAVRMTDRQAEVFQDMGGSPWFRGLINLEIRRREAEQKTKESAAMTTDKTIVPATLSGRSNKSSGSVVHAVLVSPQELISGIKYYASSLCGKTHGARSAGWSHDLSLAVTCQKCLKLAQKPAT